MTAQCSESLIYQGNEYNLCAEPLESFLQSSASTLKFHASSTDLWRGYIGTWAIENERLYLVKLSGHVRATDGTREVGLEALFPDYPDGVFAHWFTGVLRCPIGALLRYVHGGFGSTYEKDLFIPVQRGVVMGERWVVNGVAKPDAPNDFFLAGSYRF
jgi:hypothetical protein